MSIPPRRRATDIAPIPFPVLLADVGGTNARLAILPEAHSPVRDFATVQTGDYPDFATAASATVLDTTAILPRSLLLAIAGPVRGADTKLTNADWVLDPEAIRDELNLDTVVMFNDFEALALSLPALDDRHLHKVGGGEGQTRHPRVVLGPGTGLGVAALIYADKHYTPLAGEGGHVDFGPITARDFEIWPHLERFHGRITGETLLSGNGLGRIYRAVARANGADPSVCKGGPDVTRLSEAGDSLADEAIDLFLTYLGRLAGDFALLFLAKGGVYIAGGIAPRLADRIQNSGFRAAFEDKAPHAAIMKTIPTYLIVDTKPAIEGMAHFATMPERFALDLSGRRYGV
jgi:glucokinase